MVTSNVIATDGLILNSLNITQDSKAHYQQVLLSTVTILIADQYENFHEITALLDSGSLSNLMAKLCVTR